MLTPDLLVEAIGCSRATAVRFAPHLTIACREYGIDQSAVRLAPFFAQTGHESASYSRQTESFDYAPERLAEVFGAARAALAMPFARQPGKPADQPALAEAVYGGEWGLKNLGNTRPGDGWRFRARGPIGTTGRGNYARLRTRLRARFGPEVPDFEANPDALEDPRWGALSAADYWDGRNCNALAERGDFEAITRAINGGMNGHADRLVRLQRARAALAGWQPDGATNPPAPAPTPQPAPRAPSIPAGESGDAPENNTMAPALIPLAIDAIGALVPSLIRTFGSGSQMAERNAKAAELAVDVAKRAAGAVNEQQLIEKLQTDPATQVAVREAVTEKMGDILDLMVKANEADEKSRAAALDRNLQLGQASGGRWLWLLGAVVLIVILASYGITAAVLFTQGFTSETKALLLGQVVIFGFGTVLAWLFGSNIANRLSQQANMTKGQQ